MATTNTTTTTKKVDIAVVLAGLNVQARYAIVFVAMVLFLLLNAAIVWFVQIAGIRSLEESGKKLNEDISHVSVNVQHIPQMKEGLDNTKAQLSALQAKIKPSQEISAVVQEVSRIAQELGIELQDIRPLPNEQETLLTLGKEKYYSLPIVVKTLCGYHMFGKFLSKLESADMFFIVKDLRMQASKIDPSKQSVELTLKLIFIDQS